MRLDLTTGAGTFTSETTARFRCSRPGATTFIELIAPSLGSARLNGETLPAHAFDGGRIRLEGLAAQNVLEVSANAPYMHDGTGMHWFEDPVDGRIYLHSMCAEYEAHRVFACFNQPDLKATHTFEVRAPVDWTVVSNTPVAHRDGEVWRFGTSQLMSTYLAAIVAGHYRSVTHQHRDIPLGLFCRESLAEYLDPDEIFEITGAGLDYFEERFGHRYAFGKYDQLFVPEFSSGAMENPACVTINEAYVFRSRVTDALRSKRAEMILHEMAHMWFGDLVTLRWWNDLWLNESFAEYMGVLASFEATRFKNAWTAFAAVTKEGARVDDQLPTTHPIVADVPDVESMHLNLDRITYNKGAAALQQLVGWVGEAAFFKGVEAYFKKHAYGNAELDDFLDALEQASGRELRSWSRLWLEQAGVNTLAAEVTMNGATIKAAAVLQGAPELYPVLRPHRLRIGLFDLEDSALKRRRTVELDIDGARTAVPQLAGEPSCDCILVNDGDLTYAKLRLDRRSVETLRAHLLGLDDPLARALSWAALWDMTRDAELRAAEYVETSLHNIDVETDAYVVGALIGRMVAALEVFGDPGHRAVLRASLAAAAKDRLSRLEPGSDLQLLWTNAFIGAAREAGDVTWVRGLLDGTTRLEGLEVDFAVRWTAVNALATIGVAGEDLIAAEVQRDPTDMGRRAATSARAAQPLPGAKARAWSTVTGDKSIPLATKRAAAAGFHGADQERLLSHYVQPYFESLLPIWESRDLDEALVFVEGMYPARIATPEVVELTDTWLARDLPGPVRRSLLESQDGIKRALRTRAFDAGIHATA